MIYYIRDEEGSLIGLKYNNKIYYYIKNLQEDIIGITDSNYNELIEYLKQEQIIWYTIFECWKKFNRIKI